MTKRKKVLLITGIILAMVAISGLGFAFNSRSSGFYSFHRHGFIGMGSSAPLHDEIKDFIIWKMDKGVQNLQLSETQKIQYNSFRSALLETMEQVIQVRTGFKQKMLSDFEKEDPDLAEVANDLKNHMEALSKSASMNLSRFSDFYNCLDANQQKSISHVVKEKIQSHHSRFSCNEKEI